MALEFQSTMLANSPSPTVLATMIVAIPSSLSPTESMELVFINGFNLGRYYFFGPQQELYVPGSILNAGGKPNNVVVLELEPQAGKALSIEGLDTRTWGNNPDPDAPAGAQKRPMGQLAHDHHVVV